MQFASRTFRLSFIGCAVLAAAGAASAGEITISEATTHVTAPLRADGWIDFLGAVNARTAQGVTAENNAAVVLVESLDDRAISPELRAGYYAEWGIPAPSGSGPHLVPFGRWADGILPAQAAMAQHDRTMEGPWTAEECPEAARWLEEHAAVLDRLVEASRRERFYAPLLSTPDMDSLLIAALMPAVQEMRGVARALVKRALHRLAAGDREAAWQDVLACHRWARLAGQGPTLIEALVATAIDGMACRAGSALAHHGGLSRDEAERWTTELRGLPPGPSIADAIDMGERLLFLDIVQLLARRGDATHEQLMELAEIPPSFRNVVSQLTIDWDEILRQGNAWYDRIASAARQPTRAARLEQFAAIDDELQRQKAALLQSGVFTGTQDVGSALLVLLTPAVSQAHNAEDRAVVSLQLAELSLGLAAWRHEHGSYPADLAQLVPAHFPELPSDLFASGPFRYEAIGPGYRLYSVGPNGQDEGGRQDTDDVALADTLTAPRFITATTASLASTSAAEFTEDDGGTPPAATKRGSMMWLALVLGLAVAGGGGGLLWWNLSRSRAARPTRKAKRGGNPQRRGPSGRQK